jgi:hypothetical protein
MKIIKRHCMQLEWNWIISNSNPFNLIQISKLNSNKFNGIQKNWIQISKFDSNRLNGIEQNWIQISKFDSNRLNSIQINWMEF